MYIQIGTKNMYNNIQKAFITTYSSLVEIDLQLLGFSYRPVLRRQEV